MSPHAQSRRSFVSRATMSLDGLMGQEVDTADEVPQSQPLDDRQVANNAGGFVYKIDDTARFKRFLILGSEGGTYYVTEQKLTLDNARCVKRLLDEGKGRSLVDEIVRVSTEGRAPKQQPGVFALALCCRLGDAETKRAAFEALPKVCRTASTLFDFVNFAKAVNQEVAESEGRKVGNASWGRAMRHAVANWYLTKTPMALAYQVTKYVQRGGWSNRDLLRLAHPQPGYIKVAAQKQAESDAADALKKVRVSDEDDDWSMVDDSASVRSLETAPDAEAHLNQLVEDMQRVFKFIVNEEAAPAAEDSGRVERYLADAHRLKKAQVHPDEPLLKKEAAETEPCPEAAPATSACSARSAHRSQLHAPTKAPSIGDVLDAAIDAAMTKSGGGSNRKVGSEAAAVTKELQAAHRAGSSGSGNSRQSSPRAAATKRPAAEGPADMAVGSGDAQDAAAAAEGPGEGKTAADGKAEVPVAKKRKVEKQRLPVAPITVAECCDLIKRHRFSREHVGDTRLLKSIPVWSALLSVGMPFTALTRNLGRLTSLGVFDPQRCEAAATHLEAVTSRFRDVEAVQKAHAHPIVLLNAMRVYASGRGDLGGLSWEPHVGIVSALDAGFYLAFKNVQPTGKRFLLGLDVSGSMGWCQCAGMSGLTPREAAAATSMCLLRTEAAVTPMAFSTTFQRLPLAKTDSLQDALNKTNNLDFGGTDCALPMTHALEKGLKVDVFVVMTDNETWAGRVHPMAALQQYRQKSGIPAKLLVCAFAGTSHSVADPEDAGTLDIPGLDSGVPEVMRQFVLGQI